MRIRVSDEASRRILEVFRCALECMNMPELKRMEQDIILEQSKQTSSHLIEINEEELTVVREEIESRKK